MSEPLMTLIGRLDLIIVMAGKGATFDLVPTETLETIREEAALVRDALLAMHAEQRYAP